MTLLAFIQPTLFAFTGAFFLCLGIIATRDIHGHLTLDDRAGVQKIHTDPTPRVGGIALYIAAMIGGLALPQGAQMLWWPILLALLPAFLTGMAEDMTKHIGVKWRLLATMVSGLIFCLLTGYQLVGVGISWADWLLSNWTFALIFTAFALGGVANAINIIDGVNGLASGCSLIIFAGFGVLSYRYGDAELLGCILVGAAVLAGFFVLNFPYGKIFLGDAGAVSMGFLLAVVAVMLPLRNPEISPLIGLTALIYPVVETFVSIWRRIRRVDTHPGQADRLHLHSLIYRNRARRVANWLGRPHLRSAITSVMVGTLPLLSTIIIVSWPEDNTMMLTGAAGLTLLYLGLYRRVALLRPMFLNLSYRSRNPAVFLSDRPGKDHQGR